MPKKMCGIIAYKGMGDGVEIVLKGLKKLEYRGYDSWGIAVNGEKMQVVKKVGRIGDVSLKDLDLKPGNMAVGHTRWSTHGGVTEKNAHPHLSNNGKIAVVHNGIVENYQELREFLIKEGFRFESQTDTEVIPNLIQYNINKGFDFEEAMKKTVKGLEGRYAIVAINQGNETVLGARRGSPLVVGVGEREFFIASDVPAFLDYTNKVVFLDDNELIAINNKIEIIDLETGKEIKKKIEIIDWTPEEAEKGSYPFFMIKEVLEQRESIMRAVNQDEAEIMKAADMINKANGVFFVGCGTAGKVALAGTYMFSKIAKKHVNFAVGSEFPNYHHFLTNKTLLIAVSQSGETADTLEAIEAAKKEGVKIISIVNVIGSTMTRQSDFCILIKAGPEKCVASTKATTGQLAILTLLAYACAGKLDEGKKLLSESARNINKLLTKEYLQKIEGLAKKLKNNESMYAIGRGLNYPMALESAIKIQEVSYIHAEGFAGGELKHYSIALICEGTPCIALVANDETKRDILGNAVEIKSRGGFIIGVSPEDNQIFDFWIPVPDAGNASPIVNIIPVQLLAYYLALERNCDPDKPRNLAKSVTVK